MEFESLEASRIIECELHPNLRITAVRDAATQKVLEVDRDDYSPLTVPTYINNGDDLAQRWSVQLTVKYTF